MNADLSLERFTNCEQGVFGSLTLPDGWQCYICERPWTGNKVGESCIPAGVYDLRMRMSEIVEETTDGRYVEGWEVTGVPGRTFIMLHPGNHIEHTEGCLLPGADLSGWQGKWAVTNSQDTFQQLMRRLQGREVWTLDIRWQPAPEYP